MTVKRIVIAGAALLAALQIVSTSNQGRAADLGSPAPALDIAQWIKGGPVALADGKGKKVYVVEFWATWCPPCRTSIPHLTSLQKKFKDKGIEFIGISDEQTAVVRKFVDKMGDQMEYTVAVDNERKTASGYMKAFGIDGIPHAFVVDRSGRIVWHGHPMADLEETLQQIIDGKYDMAAAQKRAGARQKIETFFELVMEGGDEARIESLGKELEALDAEVGGILEGGRHFRAAEARQHAQFSQALRKWQMALFSGQDDAAADELAKKAESLAPAGVDFPEIKGMLLAQRLFSRYLEAVGEKGDAAQAADLGRQLSKAEIKNPTLLNQFAWTILTGEQVKKRDPSLAAQLAKTAYDLSEGKNSSIADTYARALFDTGKVAEAVRLQQKAIDLCEDAGEKAELESTLKRYQAALPAATPSNR